MDHDCHTFQLHEVVLKIDAEEAEQPGFIGYLGVNGSIEGYDEQLKEATKFKEEEEKKEQKEREKVHKAAHAHHSDGNATIHPQPAPTSSDAHNKEHHVLHSGGHSPHPAPAPIQNGIDSKAEHSVQAAVIAPPGTVSAPLPGSTNVPHGDN
jgi:cobalamin biosynthesis Mg chelatase CobN